MSQSPDNIPAYFQKQVGFTLVHIMTYLFNLTLHQGVIPNEWKHAIITPTYKKSSQDKPIKYFSYVPHFGNYCRINNGSFILKQSFI